MEQATVVDRIVEAVRRVTGAGTIALHLPFILPQDMLRIRQTNPIGYDAITDFEIALQRICHVKHAIAVSSGTAALHLGLLALGVHRFNYVQMPSLTFAAAGAAVCYCNAHPLFADDPFAASFRPKVRMVVDLLGFPAPSFEADCLVLEDAAAALGSSLDGTPCGSIGDVGILSFNNNKIVTTGGGGAVLTDDDDIAEFVRHMATTAKIPSPYFFEHDAVGFNYRMSNMAAALGCEQLVRLPKTLKEKRALHHAYAEEFAKIDGVRLRYADPGTKPNYWLNALHVAPELRDPLLVALNAAGLGSRALYTPLHMQKPYARFAIGPEERASSEDAFATTVCLPSGRIF